jgi:glycosyltransferase involved in cell wall biosynthesis
MMNLELWQLMTLGAVAMLLPRALLGQMLGALARWTGLSPADREAVASGLVLFATAVVAVVLLAPAYPALPLLPLLGILTLAALLGTLEIVLRLASQFTIPARFLLALCCWGAGFQFQPSETLESTGLAARLLIDLPVTMVFYLGLITSFAVLDRLRGVASGVAMVTALGLLGLTIDWATDNSPALMVIVGAMGVGHLFARRGVRTMLGPTGQLIIAIMLGIGTLSSRSWGFTLTLLMLPLIALILPAFDRIHMGLLRLSHGHDESRSMNLHSLLLTIGLTERWIVSFIWLFTLQGAVLLNVVYETKSPMFVGIVAGTETLALTVLVLCLVRVGERLERERSPGKLRILFLSHYFAPEVNAPASRLYEHARLWAAAGHDVTVVCPVPSAPHGWPYPGYSNHFWAEENLDGIRVVRVWTFVAANKRRIRRTLNYASFMMSALVALLFLRRHDVLVATSPQFFCGLAGAVGSLFRKEPFVLEVRDLWPESIEAVGAGQPSRALRMVGTLARWMYSRAQLIVTVGEGYRDRLVAAHGIAPSRLCVIPNGVDPATFHEVTAGPAVVRRAPEEFIVSYVGTLGMAHGLDVVLGAAGRLAGEPRVVFVLAGDGAEKARLEEEAARRGLANVRFMGLLPKEVVPRLIAESDACLVHLKRRDLFRTVLPSKMFEAMAMRRPVLMGVEGHAREVLEEAGAGIPFVPEDDESLAAAIRALMADPALGATMGERGAAFCKRHFSRPALASRYIDVIRAVANRQAEDPAPPPADPPPTADASAPAAAPGPVTP